MTLAYSYPAQAYTTVLKTIQGKFKLDNNSLPPQTWIIWRRRIKELFEQGFTVQDILNALDEASIKQHWPSSTSFWVRVRDIMLLTRRNTEKVVKVDGMASLGSLLPPH